MPFRRLVRYATVSAVATVVGLATLAVLVGLGGWPAGWANVVATALGTVPSFELNRRWVWRRRPGAGLARQASPFVAYALAELAVSSLAVHAVASATATLSWPPWLRTGADLAANVATYGALWAGQFVLCDRFLFRPSGPAVPETRRPRSSVGGR